LLEARQEGALIDVVAESLHALDEESHVVSGVSGVGG
jgi:hypothetical protein